MASLLGEDASDPEFAALRLRAESAVGDRLKLKRWMFDRTLRLVYEVARSTYGGSVATMVESSMDAGENARCSAATAELAASFKWSLCTTRKYFGAMKAMFAHLDFDEGFVRTFRLMRDPVAWNKALPMRYGTLKEGHPLRQKLESWTDAVRENSGARSDVTVRHIIKFYLSTCLPRLGLDVESVRERDPRTATQVTETLRDAAVVEGICASRQSKVATRKAKWLKLLVQDVFLSDATTPDAYLKKQRLRHAWGAGGEEDDGSDKHRIRARDLDAIYDESVKDPKNELLFLLMITTGLRIGGVSRIQIRHVAEIQDKRYKVKSQGRTKEKGGKWVSFMLTTRVQELVLHWLTKLRPADRTQYLFPGRFGHIATATIRGRFGSMCRARRLQGRQFHPHALRHSYAHILLEMGNPIDVVSKALNHSSSAVTEQFYLRESAVEVHARANIPWMKGAENGPKRTEDIVPKFLGGASAQATAQSRGEAKRSRIDNQLEALETFTCAPMAARR